MRRRLSGRVRRVYRLDDPKPPVSILPIDGIAELYSVRHSQLLYKAMLANRLLRGSSGRRNSLDDYRLARG
jgi:hypothetical protein